MNVQCFHCGGVGCAQCRPLQSTMSSPNFDNGLSSCSSTLNSPPWLSTGNLMTAWPYSNPGHTPDFEELIYAPQTTQRSQTYSFTAMPTSQYDPALFAPPAPQQPHAYRPVTFLPSNHNLDPSSSPTPQRAYTYPPPSASTAQYIPLSFGDPNAICVTPQSQHPRRTLSDIVPVSQHPQAYASNALQVDCHNAQIFGFPEIVCPVPKPRPVVRTLAKLAPKSDKHPRHHGSHSRVDKEAPSSPPDTSCWCMPCNRRFSNAGNFNRHNDHHCPHRTCDKTKYPCSECTKSLSRPDLVTKHVKQTHKKVTCDACNEDFKGERALSKHMRNFHDVSGDDSMST
jgi:hypothetical protein